MAHRNLAEEPSLAATLAPPFALIPGLALPQLVSETYSPANSAQYAGLIVIVAYAFMWLLAIPILRVTRRRILWTPIRVILLGTGLGAAAWLLPLLWNLGHDAVRWGPRDALDRLPGYEWFPVLWFGACGLFVALVFVVIQHIVLTRLYGSRS